MQQISLTTNSVKLYKENGRKKIKNSTIKSFCLMCRKKILKFYLISSKNYVGSLLPRQNIYQSLNILGRQT
jgi:hypothetical protein